MVSDFENNVYRTAKVGDQIWMAENLKVTHYSDGTPLIDGTGVGNISDDFTSKYWFVYGNNIENKSTYGLLYSWAGIMNGENSSDAIPSGIQGVCPVSWHIPSDAEWKVMEQALGMSLVEVNKDFEMRGTDEGGKLKEVGTAHWTSPNTAATNSTGFTALPGGVRYDQSQFGDLGIGGYFWTSTEIAINASRFRELHYESGGIWRHTSSKPSGYSVRCVKD